MNGTHIAMNGRPSLETLGSNTDVTSLVNLAYEVDGLTISTEANFARVADDINENIDVLTKNIQQIERLHSEAIYSTSPFKHTQVLRSREQYAADTDSVIATIRSSLQVLAHAASDPHIFKSDRAMRSNRLVALARKYHDQIDTYRRMEREQANRNRDRLVRLYRLACPDASDDDIFAAIDNIKAREAMERKVTGTCKPGEARKIIKDVNDRIGDIANIEHTVSELTRHHIEITDMISREQTKLDTITGIALSESSMAGIAMAAHQPEEGVSQYSYTKHKDGEDKPVNTAHSRISSHSTTAYNGSKPYHSSGIIATTAAAAPTPLTPSASASASTTASATVATLNTYHNGRSSVTGESNGRGRNPEYGSRIPATAAALGFGRNSQAGDPVAAYHEQQMRQKVQQLVSSTTRFDRVTGGALAFLSDIARLYLLRIGEACRARADLANRTEPNLYDVVESTTADMGIDWDSVASWVDEWRVEVGSTTTGSPLAESIRASGHTPHTNGAATNGAGGHLGRIRLIQDGSSNELTQGSDVDGPSAPTLFHRKSADDADLLHDSESTFIEAVNPRGDGTSDEELDEILSDLNLGCLLLDESDRAEGTQAIVMPHLPPLVLPSETDENGGQSDVEMDVAAAALAVPVADHTELAHGNIALDSEVGAEESPESVMAQLLHFTTTSLSILHPSIATDKPLYSFFRPTTKFDSTCAPDDVLPDFDIPEAAFVPAHEHVEQRLSEAGSVVPGKPMFVFGDDTSERDVFGDSEKMWQEARSAMYQNIYDDAAQRAIDEMDNAPQPMQTLYPDDSDTDDDIDSEPEQLLLEDDIGDIVVDGERSPHPTPNADGAANATEYMDNLDSSVLMQEDIVIDEDLLDIDMGMDIDFDFDLDVVGNPAPTAADGPVEPVVDGAVSTAIAGPSDAQTDIAADTNPHPQPQPQPEEQVAGPESEPEPEPVVSDIPVNLPISSALRGSGEPHWATEWFTPAMVKRLVTMTAEDIVPYDSLFMSDTPASKRLIVDEVARAFVDSEGGGHMHESTPLNGIGPAGNSHIIPNSSGSALRWTLHHLVQSKGAKAVDSLYSGRSSLAGGVSGDGISQYIGRMCSLVKASAEEEAEQVVSGALGLRKDKGGSKIGDIPDQGELIEQLVVGSDKRIPWAQNRLDIHVIESSIAGRPPQKAVQTKQPPPFPTSFLSAASVSASRPETPVVMVSSDPSSGRQSIRASSPPSLPPGERRDSFVDIGGEVVEHNPTPSPVLIPSSSPLPPPPPPLPPQSLPPPLPLSSSPLRSLPPPPSPPGTKEQGRMPTSADSQGPDHHIEPIQNHDQTNAIYGPAPEHSLPLLEQTHPLLLLPPSPMSSAAPQLGEKHETQHHGQTARDSDTPI
ncbi:hypothetical protein GGI15_000971 [Coemansia interrupta]|uniref:Bromodomain associated domain-containing protein n=1 Tax=Coemansia interrupta TaxID=1126814 RepID=A0A9W8LP25_9FUNG|nr:hypothetical protein GGI15_000971 [Coemansia interrupta]